MILKNMEETSLDHRKEFFEMCSFALIRDWRHMRGWTSDLDMATRLAQLDAFSPQHAKTIFSKEFMKNLDRRRALGNERTEGIIRQKLCHLGRNSKLAFSAKQFFPGCMNPASTLHLAVGPGFTQPWNHSVAEP